MNEDQHEDDCKNQRDSIATGSKHGRQLIATVRRRNEDKKNQNLNKRNKRVTGIMMRSRDTKEMPWSHKKKKFHKNKQINKLNERLEGPSRKGHSFYSSLEAEQQNRDRKQALLGLNRRNDHITSINVMTIGSALS
jgi:hypothetical protein